MAYIEKEKLLAEIEKLKKSPWYNDDFGGGLKQARQEGVDIVVDMCIKHAPTADVAEVRHGYWMKHRDDGDCEYIECSACGEEFYPPNNEFEFDKYPKYCQECGAKMDGGRKEKCTT
jgi:hypothetical protein